MDEPEPDEPDPHSEGEKLPDLVSSLPSSPLVSPRSSEVQALVQVAEAAMGDPPAADISNEDEKLLVHVLSEEIQKKTLLDSAESGKAGSKGSTRKLKRQSTEKVVDKSLKDNFRGWSSIDIDGTVVEGLTLRETILRDKRKSRMSNDFPMGAHYYGELRKKFGCSSQVANQLQVEDEHQEVSPPLLQAFTDLKASTPKRGALLQWLATADACNQKEYTGLLRATLEQRPMVSTAHMNLVTAIMKYIVRTSLNIKHKAMTFHMQKQFDTALVAKYVGMRKDGVTTKTFVELNTDIMVLVMPNMQDLTAVLSATNSWTPYKKQLGRVVESSMLGKHMFGFAQVHIICEDIEAFMDIEIAKSQPARWNQERIHEMRKYCIAEVQKMKGIDLLPTNRIITLKYRRLKIKLPVTSIYEEFEYRKEAMLRQMAVRMKGVPPLLCENGLVDDAGDAGPIAIEVDLLKACSAARVMANSFFGDEGWCSGESIRGLLQQKKPILRQLDSCWAIEEAFIEAMCGEGGEDALKQRILDSLPNPQKGTFSMATSMQKLQEVRNSDLCRFVSRSAQGLVDSVREIIHAMSNGKAPNFGQAETTEFMKSVIAKLGNFVTAEIADPEFAEGRHAVFGKHALEWQFRGLQTLVNQGKSYDFELLENFHIFEWLIDDDMREKINTMTLTKLAELEGSGSIGNAQLPSSKRVTRKMSDEDAVANTSGKKKKKKGAANIAGDAMALFA